ncbi:MAG: hypothetical protein QG653_435 [Patescibacteria group bacterium]|nr:hypothetical protein [Patescibacteria group bacterium]
MHVGNPLHVREDGVDGPEECEKYEEDVDCGEKVVLQSKLKWSECEIENEVKNKWNCNRKWKLLLCHH